MASLKQLIADTCGHDRFMLSRAYFGLSETPVLREFNPYLDLDEILTFAAESWIKRDKEPDKYQEIVDQSSLYDIFRWTYSHGGYGLLKNRKSISDDNQKFYEKNNPYQGELLEQRLRLVPEEYESKLRSQLKSDAHTYARNEKHYQEIKASRGGNNYNLEIIPFNKVYTRREEMPQEYARLIHGIIKDYPVDMHNDPSNK